MRITKYESSEGEEYFLEFVNKDNILFGLCRLRIVDDDAFVRELHIYGQALSIGEKAKKLGQHKGLGKQLMLEAEGICKGQGVKKLKVISGVGVREYYKKLSYKLEEEYMVKGLG